MHVAWKIHVKLGTKQMLVREKSKLNFFVAIMSLPLEFNFFKPNLTVIRVCGVAYSPCRKLLRDLIMIIIW